MEKTLYSDLKQILLNYKTIGICLSGGLDSSVLFYCLMTVRNQEQLSNTDITVFTVDRPDNSKEHSANILNYINQTFGTKITQHFVGNGNLRHDLQVYSGIQEAKKQVDCLILSDNIAPKHLADDEWCPKRVKLDWPRDNIYQPWFDLTKDKIVKIAIDMELIDLFKLSHSCTESSHTRCGKCWQCRERSWAFNQNKYIDPGNL